MRTLIFGAMTLALGAVLGGCVAGKGIEYNAGDLGKCWEDFNVDFCVVNANRNTQAIVNGTSLLAGASQAAGAAMSGLSVAGAIRAVGSAK